MTAVLVFAKAPRLGEVKTRLARDIGEADALEVYRAVGGRVVCGVATDYPVTVWYYPPEAGTEMREWLGDHEFRAQHGRDLGERLSHAFASHFSRGAGPVLAIGADAPGVSTATIREAVAALAEVDVVLGPAVDGGYYLLGLNRFESGLFTDIPWSSDRVLQVTVARCRSNDLRVRQLGALRDLDTAEDLRALGLGRP
jgi:rSAM/selenodomain-associated transferase 1